MSFGKDAGAAKHQITLVRRALKKLTKPQAKAILELGMMLGHNDNLGAKLLLELDKP